LEDRQLLSIGLSAFGAGNLNKETFVLGLDSQVYQQKFDTNGNPTTGYTLTRPGQVKAMAVANVTPGGGSNTPMLFVIGLDDQVWAQNFNGLTGDSKGAYFLTQPGQVKSITPVNVNGHAELFVRGLDDQVYQQQFDLNGNSLGAYTLTTAGQVKSLAVTFFGGIRLEMYNPEMFVIGLDDQVYQQKFDTGGNSTSAYTLTRPGQVKSLQAGLSRDITSGRHPEVFIIGLDNQVYIQQFDSTGASVGPYSLTQPGQVQSIAVGSVVQSGAVFVSQLFVIGLDSQVHTQKFDFNGTSTGMYALSSPGQVKAMSVSADFSTYGLFVIGLDDQVYEQKQNVDGTASGGYFLTTAGAVKD
jgi:hypothetical protein